MKILVTGCVGQVAWELRRTLACLGDVVAVELGSSPLSLDLADADSIRHVVQTVKPGLIVNAAAYTAVDKAEQNQGLFGASAFLLIPQCALPCVASPQPARPQCCSRV